MVVNRRLVFGIVAATCAGFALILSIILDPGSNATYLQTQANYHEQALGTYRSLLGCLILQDHRSILALHVGRDPGYFPVEYLLASKNADGKIEVQLICGPGVQNVIILKQEQATAYLKQHNLSL